MIDDLNRLGRRVIFMIIFLLFLSRLWPWFLAHGTTWGYVSLAVVTAFPLLGPFLIPYVKIRRALRQVILTNAALRDWCRRNNFRTWVVPYGTGGGGNADWTTDCDLCLRVKNPLGRPVEQADLRPMLADEAISQVRNYCDDGGIKLTRKDIVLRARIPTSSNYEDIVLVIERMLAVLELVSENLSPDTGRVGAL